MSRRTQATVSITLIVPIASARAGSLTQFIKLNPVGHDQFTIRTHCDLVRGGPAFIKQRVAKVIIPHIWPNELCLHLRSGCSATDSVSCSHLVL